MPRQGAHSQTFRGLAFAFALLASPGGGAAASAAELVRPDVVLITVDTLRYDRLSINGYYRPTSPHVDALLADGVRFEQARVTEPLTGPSMVSLVTSSYPHVHAASRNGVRMRSGMLSLPKVLASRGYQTVALVGNWTLRDELTGLGEHFDELFELFTRKRYLFFKGEATADDLTDQALEWVEDHLDAPRRKPFLLWIHYVEPHGPYRLHEEFLEPLGIRHRDGLPASDRYDTEVAFVDRAIGRLLDGLTALEAPEGMLVHFSSDHGESLGEHDYWGHGRHVYDVTLRVPMSFTWKGRIKPGVVTTPVSNLDVAPTILGLVGLPSPEGFAGVDLSPVLLGQAKPDEGRVTHHQAHKGVLKKRSDDARQKGLLEVALVGGGKKEMVRLKNGVRRVFDLAADPYETKSVVPAGSAASAELDAWTETVRKGLVEADLLPSRALSGEELEKMKALGYVD